MAVWLIDESKASGYTIVAASVTASEQARLRKEIGSLRMPRQRRIHFTKESDARRKLILSTFERLTVRAVIYHSRDTDQRRAREACLREMTRDAVAAGARKIVLEADDSIVGSDRRILFDELGHMGARDQIAYAHENASDEPLLCIPDAIAWSFARGGDWVRRIQPLVVRTKRLH